jgi:hypothetical protein
MFYGNKPERSIDTTDGSTTQNITTSNSYVYRGKIGVIPMNHTWTTK